MVISFSPFCSSTLLPKMPLRPTYSSATTDDNLLYSSEMSPHMTSSSLQKTSMVSPSTYRSGFETIRTFCTLNDNSTRLLTLLTASHTAHTFPGLFVVGSWFRRMDDATSCAAVGCTTIAGHWRSLITSHTTIRTSSRSRSSWEQSARQTPTTGSSLLGWV